MAKHVLHAHAGEGRGALFAQAGGNGFTQPADDIMLFHGDDTAGFFGSFDHQVPVQGLDRVHVDEPGVDPLSGQGVHGLNSLAHHQSGGDDRHVAALPQGDAFADLESVVIVVVAALHR